MYSSDVHIDVLYMHHDLGRVLYVLSCFADVCFVCFAALPSCSRLRSFGSLSKRLKTGVNSKQFSNKENLLQSLLRK